MAECSKCGSPVCKCGPLHYSDSPLNQFGSLASMASASRLSAKSMLDSLNKNNSESDKAFAWFMN